MNQPILLLTSATLCLFAALAQAAETVQFVSCPVYRDARAGAKSGCWLADDPASGQRYDISLSPTKPDWNFQVLVEGIPAGGTDACGGQLLEPVRVSILEQSCPRHMLAAENYPGHPFERPAKRVAPLNVERDVPEAPFTDRTFHVLFDFNRDFVIYQFGDYYLDKAIYWLLHAKPRKIKVTGYADTQPRQISNFELSEDADLARKRAEIVRKSMVRMGLPEQRIELKWSTSPTIIDVEGVNGLPTTSVRRVDIQALF